MTWLLKKQQIKRVIEKQELKVLEIRFELSDECTKLDLMVKGFNILEEENIKE